jgi:hypothetical protein
MSKWLNGRGMNSWENRRGEGGERGGEGIHKAATPLGAMNQ